MKVLFVSRGDPNGEAKPVVKNQGLSLIAHGVDLVFFTIQGKGLLGYLRSAIRLKHHLKKHKYDVVHAHYFHSAVVATLLFPSCLVVSLMGSDVMSDKMSRISIRLFNRLFWKVCVVKSAAMKDRLGIDDVQVISNGVDMELFIEIDRTKALEKTGWHKNKKHILFAARPDRPEKNYQLAERACRYFDENEVELHALSNIPRMDMPYYYNACDAVLLTSLWEGSPNVIKEAMACNRPIVSTDVGDVRALFDGVSNCFLSSSDELEIYNHLKKVICSQTKSKSRDRLFMLGLDSATIARKLIEIYRC